MKNKHILITGASGFVGGAVARALMTRGDAVSAIVRPGSNPPAGCIGVPVSGLTQEALCALTLPEDIDCIIHCAAYGVDHKNDPVEMIRINVDYPRALVELAKAKGIARIILTGTFSEYADHAVAPFDPSQPLKSGISYGGSKADGIVQSMGMANDYGIEAVALRLYFVFGPGERDKRFFPALVESLRAGRPFDMTLGEQIWDRIYVKDVVRAYLAALDIQPLPAPRIFDVCSGNGVSLRHFATTVARVMQADPGLLKFGAKDYPKSEIMYAVGNPSAMTEALALADITTLEDAIKDALEQISANR